MKRQPLRFVSTEDLTLWLDLLALRPSELPSHDPRCQGIDDWLQRRDRRRTCLGCSEWLLDLWRKDRTLRDEARTQRPS